MAACLVTGSRGFVGRFLVEALKSKGNKVFEVDLETGLDITRWEMVAGLPAAEVIIHLAARSYVPDSFEEPRDFFSVNLLGTLNALELSRWWKAKLILASSYVYGKPQYLPIDEIHPTDGFNPYAQSKILCEQLCVSYSRHFGVKCIIMRIFNIFGPGQNKRFLIPSILKQLENGQIKLADPEPRRDYVFVEDVVEAYLKAIEYEPDSFEVFNIGSGQSHSVREIVDLFMRLSHKDFPVLYENKKRENEIANIASNCDKAKRLLKWSTKTDFESGISRIIAALSVV